MRAQATIRCVACVTRHVRPRGTDRALRLLHSPDHRGDWSIKCRGRLPSGAQIHIDTARFMEWTIFFYGGYEPQLEEAIRKHVTDDSVAIDVGANIGVHSLQMASRAARGLVLSFEPNPLVYPRLVANVQLNGLRNVRARQLAVSNAASTLAFSFPEPEEPNQGTGAVSSSGDVHVQAVTIDDQVRVEGLERVDFMKVDTEGWEASVLAGAEETLTAYQPVLVFEYAADCWADTGGDLDSVLRLLRRCGYKRFYTINQRRSVTPRLDQRRSPVPLNRAQVPAAGNILATT